MCEVVPFIYNYNGIKKMNEANLNKNDLLKDFVSPSEFEEKDLFFRKMKKICSLKSGSHCFMQQFL